MAGKVLPTVTLGTGNGALEGVTSIGYGAMGLDAFMGAPLPRDESLAVLKAVYDAGVRLIDTAEIYRNDAPKPPTADSVWNEETVGAFLKTVPRESVTIATKYFPLMHENPTDPAVIAATVDASLARLGTTYVDLYYVHRMPPGGKAALLAWVSAMVPIVKSGKVKALGLSEVPPDWIEEAHAIHPIAAIQQEWSVMTRGLEKDIIPTCVKLGISIVAYSPLARGLVGATASTQQSDAVEGGFRATLPRFQGEAFEKNVSVVSQIADIAAAHSTTAAAVCLAWLHAKAKAMGVVCVPIPGSRNVGRAAGNAAAVDIALTDADMAVLEEISSKVVGERGSSEYLSRSYEGVSA